MEYAIYAVVVFLVMFILAQSHKSANGCPHRHYKEAGYPVPENMKEILEFDRNPKEYDHVATLYSFGIRECEHCGVRSFACGYYHCFSDETCSIIDKFIAHKIEMPALLSHFEAVGIKYKLIAVIDKGE